RCAMSTRSARIFFATISPHSGELEAVYIASLIGLGTRCLDNPSARLSRKSIPLDIRAFGLQQPLVVGGLIAFPGGASYPCQLLLRLHRLCQATLIADGLGQGERLGRRISAQAWASEGYPGDLCD
ncbi:MAG TPA: hypothetical protein VE735_03345, partial [Gammaproteobacteria bacterium]|nr:hypothetical protein [Gammaproteobacteria bacterium]